MRCLPVLRRVGNCPLRVELTIRKPSDPSGARPVKSPRRFPQLKSALMAFLLLSGCIGILIAAFVLGSVLAIILVGIVILILTVALIRLPFRKLKRIHKENPYEDR